MLLERLGITVVSYTMFLLTTVMLGYGIVHETFLVCLPILILSVLQVTLMTWYSMYNGYDGFVGTGWQPLDKVITHTTTAIIYTSGAVGVIGIGAVVALPLIATFVMVLPPV